MADAERISESINMAQQQGRCAHSGLPNTYTKMIKKLLSELSALCVQVAAMKRSYVHFALGDLLLVLVMFSFSIVAAGLIGPSKMGLWQTAVIISTYGMILTLGVISGLGREIPLQRGRGDSAAVKSATSTAGIVVFAMIIMFGAVAVGAAFSGGPESMVLVIGVALLAAKIINFHSRIVLRSFQEFDRLGAHQAVTATILLIGLVFIARSPGLFTMSITMILALSAGLVLAIKHWSFGRFCTDVYRKMVRVGLPILFVSICFSLLKSVDRILVLSLLGVEHLGLYVPAISAFGALFVLPRLVSNIVYPEMVKVYGKQGTIKSLGRPIRKLILVNYITNVSVAGVLAVSFYYIIIPLYLPEYEASRVPLLVLLASSLVLPLGSSFGDFFNVVGAQNIYLRNILVGVALNAVASFMLVYYLEWGLLGVASGTVVGLTVYAAMQLKSFLRIWAKDEKWVEAGT